ncbi:hypothetical protein K7432_015624 [Basidiobolus ranarum]|uniref:Pyrrolo-quinoline quinone repeat domain-containing protein n=1 Tax=Basidiobolus ranarum TaxID=34480 RepID=A0ABR2VNY1_9FUNG
MDFSTLLLCGAQGIVYAFEKLTGKIVWKSKVCGSELSLSLYCCPAPSDLVICGVEGKIRALRLSNGEEVWRNHVSDLGYYHVSVLATPSVPAQVRSALPPSYELSTMEETSTPSETGNTEISVYPNNTAHNIQPTLDPGLIFVASLSDVRAIDKETGSIRWKICLPNVQTGIPLLLLDHQNSILFMTCKCRVFALKASTGQEVWKWKFPNCQSTFIPMTSPSLIPNPAMYTSFHNNPCLQSKTSKSASRQQIFY